MDALVAVRKWGDRVVAYLKSRKSWNKGHMKVRGVPFYFREPVATDDEFIEFKRICRLLVAEVAETLDEVVKNEPEKGKQRPYAEIAAKAKLRTSHDLRAFLSKHEVSHNMREFLATALTYKIVEGEPAMRFFTTK